MTIQRMLSTIVLSAALALTAAASAFAHAQLVLAAPAADSTVKTGPSEVALHFNEKLEPAFSSVVVRNSTGKQVDKADAQVDPKDRATMRVSLPPLEPGTYRVEWKAMSSDTHKVSGSFTFDVQP